MRFTPTDESRKFAAQAVANAKASALLYGPLTWSFLLLSAWVKVGRTELAPYAYCIASVVVLGIFYYNNVIRRGAFFTKTVKTVDLHGDTLSIETNAWWLTQSAHRSFQRQAVVMEEKQIMGVVVLQLTADRDYVYLIRQSLVQEEHLLAMLR